MNFRVATLLILLGFALSGCTSSDSSSSGVASKPCLVETELQDCLIGPDEEAPTPTPTPESSPTPSPTPTNSPTPTPTMSPTPTPTPSPSPTPTPDPAVTAFHLVQGTTGVFIRTIQAGDTIDMNLHGTDLSIEAVTNTWTDEVNFSMGAHSFTDSASAFLLTTAGTAFSFNEASYSLSAVPKRGGVAGTSSSISFSVVYGIHDPSAYVVPASCVQPQSVGLKNKWYIDPVNGNDSTGQGTFSSPWQNLDWVIENKLHTKSAAGADIRASAPIKAGDIIYLRSGNHGSFDLSNNTVVRQAYNTDFITIKAQVGHNPVISNVRLQGASKFVFDGIQFSNQSALTLMFVDNHAFWGDSNNVIVANSSFVSMQDVSGLSAAAYNAMAPIGVNSEGNCTTVYKNSFKNVVFGVQTSGDKVNIIENVVDGFGGDGVQVSGDDTYVYKNSISNNYYTDGNHDDGIQAFVLSGQPPMLNLKIDSNTVIESTSSTKPFPGALQGIGLFDGFFQNLEIINNVVVVESVHGITVLGATNAKIVNNSATGAAANIQIFLGPHKNGTTSDAWILRNNIAKVVSIGGGMTGTGVVSHNLTYTNPNDHFTSVDFINKIFDLRLLATSSAVNAGTLLDAPSVDRQGLSRVGTPDIGAHESNY